MKKNLLVFDKGKVDSLVSEIEIRTGEDFTVVECLNPNSWSGWRQHIQYVTTALKHLFRRPASISRYISWRQTYGIYLALFNRLLPVQPKVNISIMMFIYNDLRGGGRCA